MREQPALGEPEMVRQRADGEAGQPDLAGEARGMGENGVASARPFAHGKEIARTFVLSRQASGTGRSRDAEDSNQTGWQFATYPDQPSRRYLFLHKLSTIRGWTVLSD